MRLGSTQKTTSTLRGKYHGNETNNAARIERLQKKASIQHDTTFCKSNIKKTTLGSMQKNASTQRLQKCWGKKETRKTPKLPYKFEGMHCDRLCASPWLRSEYNAAKKSCSREDPFRRLSQKTRYGETDLVDLQLRCLRRKDSIRWEVLSSLLPELIRKTKAQHV